MTGRETRMFLDRSDNMNKDAEILKKKKTPFAFPTAISQIPISTPSLLWNLLRNHRALTCRFSCEPNLLETVAEKQSEIWSIVKLKQHCLVLYVCFSYVH